MRRALKTSAPDATCFDTTRYERASSAYFMTEETLMRELHQVMSQIDALLRQGKLLNAEDGPNLQKVRLPRGYVFTTAFDQPHCPHYAHYKLADPEGEVLTDIGDANDFRWDFDAPMLAKLDCDLRNGFMDEIAKFVRLRKGERLSMVRKGRHTGNEDEPDPDWLD